MKINIKPLLLLAASIPALVTALTLPQKSCTGGNEPTTGGIIAPFPPTTNITYYQGPTGPTVTGGVNATCTHGREVGMSILDADTCTSLCTMGVSISQVPDNICTFTLYTGSTTCSGEAGEKVSHQIPEGSGSVCIDTGVYDGCDFQLASGVWSCG